MRRERHAATAKIVGYAATAILLSVLAAPVVVSAQGTIPRPASPGTHDPAAEMRERREREAQLRSVEARLRATSATPKGADAEAALRQVNEDFARILALHNEIVRDISAGKTPDLKAIAETTGEINKRANRLKKFLLPKQAATKGAHAPPPAAELRREALTDALVRLCKRIESFADNPIFDGSGTVDVEQTAKATTDLLRIVELSERLARDAARLRKTSRQ